MKKLTYSVLLAVLYPSVQLQFLNAQTIKRNRTAPLKIKFHKNIEFIGFAYSLGAIEKQYQNDERPTYQGYKKKDYYAFQLEIYNKYQSFKDHPDLLDIVSYLERIDGNDMTAFALQLKDFPHAFLPLAMKAEYLLPFSKNGKAENAHTDAEEFITLLNQFYKTVEFNTFWSVNSALYETALAEINSICPSVKHFQELEKFYNHQFRRYELVPSLTIPMGMTFAACIGAQEDTYAYVAFGAYDLQQFTTSPFTMGFKNEKILKELTNREFGHCFTNLSL